MLILRRWRCDDTCWCKQPTKEQQIISHVIKDAEDNITVPPLNQEEKDELAKGFEERESLRLLNALCEGKPKPVQVLYHHQIHNLNEELRTRARNQFVHRHFSLKANKQIAQVVQAALVEMGMDCSLHGNGDTSSIANSDVVTITLRW